MARLLTAATLFCTLASPAMAARNRTVCMDVAIEGIPSPSTVCAGFGAADPLGCHLARARHDPCDSPQYVPADRSACSGRRQPPEE